MFVVVSRPLSVAPEGGRRSLAAKLFESPDKRPDGRTRTESVEGKCLIRMVRGTGIEPVAPAV